MQFMFSFICYNVVLTSLSVNSVTSICFHHFGLFLLIVFSANYGSYFPASKSLITFHWILCIGILHAVSVWILFTSIVLDFVFIGSQINCKLG